MVVVAVGEPGVPVVCCARPAVSNANSTEIAMSPRGANRSVAGKCFPTMGTSAPPTDEQPRTPRGRARHTWRWLRSIEELQSKPGGAGRGHGVTALERPARWAAPGGPRAPGCICRRLGFRQPLPRMLRVAFLFCGRRGEKMGPDPSLSLQHLALVLLVAMVVTLILALAYGLVPECGRAAQPTATIGDSMLLFGCEADKRMHTPSMALVL